MLYFKLNNYKEKKKREENEAYIKANSYKKSNSKKKNKVFKEDEDINMIKQNIDFSNCKKVIKFMKNVIQNNLNILVDHEIKTIKKQIKYNIF